MNQTLDEFVEKYEDRFFIETSKTYLQGENTGGDYSKSSQDSIHSFDLDEIKHVKQNVERLSQS